MAGHMRAWFARAALAAAFLTPAFSCSAVPPAPPPFVEIRSESEVDEDIVLPPNCRIAEGRISWMKKIGGFRTGALALESPYPAQDLVAFFEVHMPIALWRPDGRPESSAAGWTLKFTKNLDACTISVSGNGRDLTIEVNPPKSPAEGPR